MPYQEPNLGEQYNQPSQQPLSQPSQPPAQPSPPVASPFASPPPSYYRESFPTPPAPKSKANLIKIIVGAVLVVILGAGTTLAARIWDPLWNPFRPSPEKVIAKMTEKMKEVKTLHSDGNFELDIENETAFSIKSNIWTDIDLRDSGNLMSASGYDMSFAMEGVQLSSGFETKQIGETSYMKINTIPAFPMLQSVLQMIGIDQNQLKDKWIKIDLKKLLGEAYATKQKEETKKQEVLVEKLKKLIEESTFYSVKTELPDEEIGNKKVYHYMVALNQNEIKRIAPEILKIFTEIGSSTLPFEQVTDKLQEGMDKFFEKIEELNGELWIGKEDNLLYKFKGAKDFDMSKFINGKEGSFSIKIDATLSKFNQPIEIKAPNESKTIEEILGPIIGGSLNSAGMKAKDTKIISDIGQIRIIAELLYDNFNYSYENLCNESTVSLNKNAPTYGTELADLEQDIRNQSSSDFRCFDSATSYCTTADLPSAEKGKWCIDSSGASKEISDSKGCIGFGTAKNPYKCP